MLSFLALRPPGRPHRTARRARSTPRTVLLGLVGLCGAMGCATPRGSAAPPVFVHELGAEHPASGVILETATGAEITPDALLARLAGTPAVLVGEKHDNLDHHAIEAWLVERLAEGGEGRLALVMEIFEVGESDAIAAYLDAHPGNVDGVLGRFGWGRRDTTLAPTYAPVLRAAIARRVPILGGDLDSERRRALAMGERPDDVALGPPLPDDALTALEERIRDAHCGHAPDAHLGAMVRVQRARDAQLAAAVREAASSGTALLVAGGEHVRRDVGVPHALGDALPRAVTIGLVEVPVDGGPLEGDWPFDFVWATPRVDAIDPCERFREQLESMGRGHGGDDAR